jgi:hypothetical protein
MATAESQTIYVYCKTEARSHNSFCHAEATNITYSECVSVALVIQHAMRMRHVATRVLPRSTVFFPHYLINGTIFEKQIIEHKMCIEFLCNFCLKHFSF